MKIKFLLFLFPALFVLLSCDRINAPYEEKPDENNNNVEVPRKVILTEFTGMYCAFCPAATDYAKDLKGLYGDKLILLSVHASNLAEPRPPHNLDFRIDEGIEMFSYFGGQSVPAGLVDRVGATLPTKLVNAMDWDAMIKAQLKKSAPLTIKLSAEYNPANREITADVDLEYFKDVPAGNQISLYIIEDSVIAYQKDPRQEPSDIEDYKHMHMLRATFNGTWGEAVTSGPIGKGDKIDRTFTFTIPEGKNWQTDKLHVIAFVHDFEGSKEVLQAEEAHVEVAE